MGSDAIANFPLTTYSNDSSNNIKGGRRMTQVKQNKLDVRREPWLSQVKNKGCKVEKMNGAFALPPSFEGRRTEGNISAKTTRGDERHHMLGTFDTEGMAWTSNSIDKTWGRTSNDFSGSGSSCSSSTCEEEDWETIAVALSESTITRTSPNDMMNTRPLKTATIGVNHRYQVKNKAWTPDDVYRPRSLPSLSKLHQNPTQRRRSVMTWQRVVPQPPSSCPICCEDFDVTDTSFHPCPCGFQLCLFCHKKILEVDSRCPGCRKQYDSVHPGGSF